MDSLEPDLRHLLAQHEYAHMARKVVGVGSVGTEAWIALFLSLEDDSPLFLQVKQAQPSVLERFTAQSKFSNHGERVVRGQRLMQAASDIFLGWLRFAWDGSERDYYFRQLRDWKGSVDVEGMTPAGMDVWGRMCGWTLARAHARTGDRVAIAAYLGKSDRFELARDRLCERLRRPESKGLRRFVGRSGQRENRRQHRGLTTPDVSPALVVRAPSLWRDVRLDLRHRRRWPGGDPLVRGRRVAPVPETEYSVGDRSRRDAAPNRRRAGTSGWRVPRHPN